MTPFGSFLDPQVLATDDVAARKRENAIVSVIRIRAEKRRSDPGCGVLPAQTDAVMTFRIVVHDNVAPLD